jgi:hypothetical protein
MSSTHHRPLSTRTVVIASVLVAMVVAYAVFFAVAYMNFGVGSIEKGA